jgi:hypothetical protein
MAVKSRGVHDASNTYCVIFTNRQQIQIRNRTRVMLRQKSENTLKLLLDPSQMLRDFLKVNFAEKEIQGTNHWPIAGGNDVRSAAAARIPDTRSTRSTRPS